MSSDEARVYVGGEVMASTWASSDRHDRLPRNWKHIRERVIARDGRFCVLCGQPGNHVDHIEPGDDHSLSNLRVLCVRCHDIKSGSEGGTAKARNWRKNARFDKGDHPAYLRPDER